MELTPGRRRLRRALNIPWAGIINGCLIFFLVLGGMDWWQAALIGAVLLVPLVFLVAAITGTIWGGRDFWRESEAAKEFRRKQRAMK